MGSISLVKNLTTPCPQHHRGSRFWEGWEKIRKQQTPRGQEADEVGRTCRKLTRVIKKKRAYKVYTLPYEHRNLHAIITPKVKVTPSHILTLRTPNLKYPSTTSSLFPLLLLPPLLPLSPTTTASCSSLSLSVSLTSAPFISFQYGLIFYFVIFFQKAQKP